MTARSRLPSSISRAIASEEAAEAPLDGEAEMIFDEDEILDEDLLKEE